MSEAVARQELRNKLLKAVEAIRPILEATVEEAEALATLPSATVKALQESGLLLLKLPALFGGFEADPVTQLEVIEAVSYWHAAAGWCLMIGATSIALPTVFLPDEAVAQILGDDGRIPVAASTVMPGGQAIPATSGYQLSGQWYFASGIRHAVWVVVGALCEAEGERPSRRLLVTLPVSAVTIEDNWQVAGLQGTGSCAISVSNVFVPDEFAWDIVYDKPRRGGPLYNLTLLGFVTNEHAAFALGVTRRALAEIQQIAKSNRSKYRKPLIDNDAFQRDLGRADLQLQAARALAVEVHERAWQTVCNGEEMSGALLAEMRGSAVYATEIAREICAMAFQYGGGAALYLNHPLQRCLRDIYAASQHLLMSSRAYENHGQFLLKLPDAHPMG
jgi:alkylation response protein AidB-like acyl-CoA dehydrogenase